MKPSKFRSVLIGLLILASICSYTYVNTVAIQPVNEDMEEMIDENAQYQELTLPEVQIVKKLLRTGKKLIPST